MINLKYIREQLGLSQEEMGEVLHLTREMVSKMELGKVGISPRTETALLFYLRQNNYILSDNGEVSKITTPQPDNKLLSKVTELQENVIGSQKVQIEKLEKLIAEKVILIEAYQKVQMVELARMVGMLLHEDESLVSKRMAEALRAELQEIERAVRRYYSIP